MSLPFLEGDLMLREDLIRIIYQAFDDVEQPKDLTLHVAEAHDAYDYTNDQKHQKKDFIGRWQDLPDAHILECQSALSFVDKIGMRYYLPAYMIWYLKNLDSEQTWNDHVLYSLDPSLSNPQLSAYHQERFSLFNKEQLKSCALFLKFCFTNSDAIQLSDPSFAQKQYERYWSRFENNM